jgi:hypothetical protein
MYDEAGLVLRTETVINNPVEFRVRQQVLRWQAANRVDRTEQRLGAFVPVPRPRCRANARYLDAMPVVDDPTAGK